MFRKEEENKYLCEKADLISSLKSIDFCYSNDCTPVTDITKTLRATFNFIKNNPIYVDGEPFNVEITIKPFLLANETSPSSDFEYAITTAVGIVKDVCPSFVVLYYVNENNEKIESVISYESMVYLYHPTIIENFEKYVKYINSIAPLCRDLEDENYVLLMNIANIIGKNNPNERDFTFVLGGVLTRKFKANSIVILRNLIILEELFVLPITAISGFIQNGKCNQ